MTKPDTISQRRTTPSPEHRMLGIFLGNWNLTGRQYAGPVGPAAEISGVERFEWLAGELFLIHHFEAQVGGAQAACIEITGYDPKTASYPTHTYYNDGRSADWHLTQRDERWLLTGEWRTGEGPVKIRCDIGFADEGRTRTGKWELSADGATWETFWEMRAIRA